MSVLLTRFARPCLLAATLWLAAGSVRAQGAEYGTPPGDRLASYLGRYHPLAVHFPIALLLAAALAEGLAIGRGEPGPAPAARFCAALGAAGALVAAPLGWMAAATAADPYEPAWALALHRWGGVATAALALAAVLTASRAGAAPAWRRFYRGALFSGAAVVAVTGHFGVLLAYGMRYLSW